jgi:hypothetical protein
VVFKIVLSCFISSYLYWCVMASSHRCVAYVDELVFGLVQAWL